ncbi:hypothetical protein [Lysobacter gummosus]|uniref:Lipoprotein n=1 Tax=Lysobacter gummosus TaxID=262324 RepID=A0ABY3XCD4_9GAMM|nr:hypothetical protein [Lysobacter gummosus]ALN93384.1 hypothetical protein LG3211_4450 [Lysobacter gummosus]UNP28852.1 hypothetical protein MOV92_20630 [Lysobacter gummosus]
MRDRICLLLLPLVLLAACKPATSAVEPAAAPAPAAATAAATAPTIAQAAAPAAPTVPAKASAEPDIAKGFSKDMAYADLRKRLIGAGWLPLRDPKCWDNVGGEAEVCNYLPETESCSADGFCKMWFANRELGVRIQVGTYGPYDRKNTVGGGVATKVRFWGFRDLDKPAAAACPSRDFDQFLSKFAADKNLAREFTAPVVKVAELLSDGESDRAQPVYMLASSYNGFNVQYKDGAFHYVDGQGAVDAARLRLDVSKEGADKRLVRYAMNMSEGNSYLFEDSNGCWRLTEDPEAPAP